MILQEIANHPIFKLPLIRDEEYFPKYIGDFFDNYWQLLESAEGEGLSQLKERFHQIRELIYHLRIAIDEYYLGHILQSYNSFKSGINLIDDSLMKPIPNYSAEFSDKQEELIKEFYFKGRISYGQPLPKKEMFIRPFEQREEIHTSRYSVPGLPCLYLSNSIYALWVELGCPDINSLQVSRFEINRKLKRLFFAFNINFYKNEIKRKDFFDYLTYFPLHAICNIKVKNLKGIFKPEYIFPQFLMQWITEQKLSCISYHSTKVDLSQFENPNSFFNFSNLAIPAQSSKISGYCEKLKSEIRLTESISWQNLVSSYPSLQFPKPSAEPSFNLNRSFKKSQDISLINNKKVLYDSTIFGMMEKYLIENMTADYISD